MQQKSTMVLTSPATCISSTNVCVSSGSYVSSDKVSGVTMTCADVLEGDAMGSVVVFLRRPIFVTGTMLVTAK